MSNRLSGPQLFGMLDDVGGGGRTQEEVRRSYEQERARIQRSDGQVKS